MRTLNLSLHARALAVTCCAARAYRGRTWSRRRPGACSCRAAGRPTSAGRGGGAGRAPWPGDKRMRRSQGVDCSETERDVPLHTVPIAQSLRPPGTARSESAKHAKRDSLQRDQPSTLDSTHEYYYSDIPTIPIPGTRLPARPPPFAATGRAGGTAR